MFVEFIENNHTPWYFEIIFFKGIKSEKSF